VYISVATDAFATTFEDAQKNRDPGGYNIRRPLRGIQVKPNTYASLRVLTSSGKPILIRNSSASSEHAEGEIGYSEIYANFLMQSVREERAEKQQIIETFGDDYVYFFGERPRFLHVNGMLINTQDFNWKSEFWYNYENHLRGTKLVEQNARLYLYFDDIIVEGYMMNASSTQQADQPHLMPLQFSIFITNYAILSTPGKRFFDKSDVGEPAYGEWSYSPSESLRPVPPSAPAKIAKIMEEQQPAAGGLNAFLASTSKWANDASFSIQSTIERLRDTLYARNLVVPEGLDAMGEGYQYSPPIQNKAKFEPAPTDAPIYDMTDEYVERDPWIFNTDAKKIWEAEYTRVAAALKARSPEELDLYARREFERAGIDTGKPSAMMAILGRGAFAGIQYAAPFALSKIGGGKIGQVDQVTQALAKVF